MALVKFLAVLAGLIALLRVKCPLGVALVSAGAAIGLAFGLSPREMASIAGFEATRVDAVELAYTLAFIVILSDLLQRTGQFRRISDSASGMVKDPRVAMAALPVLIGLLPMPGGALFSAPLVEALADGHSLGAERKALINYWFRHVWEYSWPLYPGVILAAKLSQIPLNYLCLAQLPVTFVALACGAVFILRGAKVNGHGARGGRLAAFGAFLLHCAPILLVIGLFLGLRLHLEICVAAGVYLVLAVGLASRSLSVREAGKAFFGDREMYQVILLAFAVYIFGGIVQASGAVAQVTSELTRVGFPTFGLAILLPFIAGLMIGITMGYVAATFPLVLAITGTGTPALPMVILAFVSGFLGTLLSPAHLCLTSTNEYFKADSIRVYRAMTVPLMLLFATGVSLFVLYGVR